MQNRDLLVFFKGKCTPLRYSWKNNATSVGKMMRYQMVKEIKALKYDPADVRVACTGAHTSVQSCMSRVLGLWFSRVILVLNSARRARLSE